MNEYLKKNYQGSTNADEIERFRTCLPIALQWLNPKQRQIIEMRFFEHMNGVEIAKMLGMTKQGVSKALNRAIKQLNDNITISLQISKSQRI